MYNYKHMSFTVSVNLLSTKKKRYVVFKPMISIIDKDRTIVQKTLKQLGMKNIIKKRKFKTYDNYQVRVQDFTEIDYILSNIDIQKLEREKYRENITSFNKLFNTIKIIGHIHKKWDDDFIKILDMKENLNDNKKTGRGFTKEEWITKIKEHFINQ